MCVHIYVCMYVCLCVHDVYVHMEQVNRCLMITLNARCASYYM